MLLRKLLNRCQEDGDIANEINVNVIDCFERAFEYIEAKSHLYELDGIFRRRLNKVTCNKIKKCSIELLKGEFHPEDPKITVLVIIEGIKAALYKINHLVPIKLRYKMLHEYNISKIYEFILSYEDWAPQMKKLFHLLICHLNAIGEKSAEPSSYEKLSEIYSPIVFRDNLQKKPKALRTFHQQQSRIVLLILLKNIHKLNRYDRGFDFKICENTANDLESDFNTKKLDLQGIEIRWKQDTPHNLIRIENVKTSFCKFGEIIIIRKLKERAIILYKGNLEATKDLSGYNGPFSIRIFRINSFPVSLLKDEKVEEQSTTRTKTYQSNSPNTKYLLNKTGFGNEPISSTVFRTKYFRNKRVAEIDSIHRAKMRLQEAKMIIKISKKRYTV